MQHFVAQPVFHQVVLMLEARGLTPAGSCHQAMPARQWGAGGLTWQGRYAMTCMLLIRKVATSNFNSVLLYVQHVLRGSPHVHHVVRMPWDDCIFAARYSDHLIQKNLP
jgi:hypothetical protein